MSAFVYLFALTILLTTGRDARNIQCPELPNIALKAILGTTYNPRYMSIQPPIDDDSNNGYGSKRASTFVENDFYLTDEDLKSNPYGGIPAWEVDHVEIGKKLRQKRDASPRKWDARDAFIDRITPKPKLNVFPSRPWECKAEVEWLDLGPDYFPRYLRSVKCKKSKCWYGHYTCKPKRFSIKVLRRSSGQCAKVNQRLRIVTFDTVTGEYAQQWEFEEKAVTFCCDCVMTY